MKRIFRVFDEALSALLVLIASGFIALNLYAAGDFGNTTIFSETDASNNSGTTPTWAEGMAPSQVNDSARALQGALTRWWTHLACSTASTGSANAYVLTYSVAPTALRNGERYCFESNFANTGTATLNINSLGAKTIQKEVDGTLTNLAANDIRSGDHVEVVYDSSSDVFILRPIELAGATASTTTEVLTGTSTSVFNTPDSLAALWEKGSDIASAGTISIGEGGYFHVTGTTTITDIDFATATNGRCAWLIFDGALTLTHNATTLKLPGAANITTAANDRAVVCQDSGDNVIVTVYETAAAAASSAEMPRGHIWGLTLSNNGADATNDIDIAAGEARGEDDDEDITLEAALTKQIDAAWTVGTNQGCMNTGSVANDTWYEIHLIRRNDTGVVDVMCSTTGNRATLPTGYTAQRRIGWVRRGTATNLAFTQVDDYFTLATQINDVAATPTTTAAQVTLTAPPSSIARFRASLSSNDDGAIVFSEIVEGNVTPAVSTGIASLAAFDGSAAATIEAAGHFELRVNSSSQIEHDANISGDSFDISTFGWIDHRGRLSN